MNTATATAPARRIAGLTIGCDVDGCDRLATHRSESKGHAGFDVHWTCTAHTA